MVMTDRRCEVRRRDRPKDEEESSLKFIFVESKEDERRVRELPCGNDRSRMRSLTQQSAKRNEKKSSLISLRKDNEVKLEDEIKKSVTSNKIESLS